MDRKLTDLALYRAGWGDNSIALDDDLTTEPADVLDSLPRLIRVRRTRGLADFLSWPDRSGRALQCLFQIVPVGRPGSSRLMAAEAVRRASRADTCEIELVDGWRGEPYFWGNRSLHEEEMEAAVHGMPPGTDLQLMSVPAPHDDDARRARILKSDGDKAVLFIAHSPQEAAILSGAVERLQEAGMLTQVAGEEHPAQGTALARTRYARTDGQAPTVTRWLGGHGTRAQQAVEGRSSRWPAVRRWRDPLS